MRRTHLVAIGCFTLAMLCCAELKAEPPAGTKGANRLHIDTVALSPDGKWIAASVSHVGDVIGVGPPPDATVRLWDSATGKRIATLRHGDKKADSPLIVPSRDGKRLFTFGDNEVKIWEVATGKQLHSFTVPLDYFRSSLSGDERWLITANRECKMPSRSRFVQATFHLWDVGAGKEVRSFEIGQWVGGPLVDIVTSLSTGIPRSDEVLGYAVSHDGKWVLAGTRRGIVYLWDASTGKLVRTFGRSKDAWATPVALSKDGKWLLSETGSLRGKEIVSRIRCWEVATGKEKYALEGWGFYRNGNGFGVSVTDDDEWLVTGCYDTTVRIWEVRTGKEVRSFPGHKDKVTQYSLSRDKKLLATYDESGTVRLWDVATGKEVRSISQSYGVNINTDANLLVATDSPRRLALWDLKAGKVIRYLDLNADE